MNRQQDKKTYDIIIYEIESRLIENIAGVNLTELGRRNSVESRLELVLQRLNDKYDAIAVEAGKYKVGDVLPYAELKK